MSEFSTIDDFLGHSGSARGGGRYLKNWTKKGHINLWLHTRRLPLAVWRHQFPQLMVFEDKETREPRKAYWGKPLGCWEDESFLKQQYKRDYDGQLEGGSPHRCAMCRMIDYLHRSIAFGKINWCDQVFDFAGSTDPKNDQVLHAGGITNLFSSDKLTTAQLSEMKSRKVYQSEAWRENSHAKLQYLFCIVDQDDVNAGVQIAAQNQMVGDKVKSVINDARVSLGDEDGNPMLNPFCIQLTYDEKAPINKRYHARRVEKFKLSPEIERMIRSEPPDLSGTVRPFNQKLLRAFLEQHALIEFPWDEIFDVPVLEISEELNESLKLDVTGPRGPVIAQQIQTVDAPKIQAIVTSGVSMIPCDGCQAPMPETAEKCTACGAVYELTSDEPPLSPLPAKRGGKKAASEKVEVEVAARGKTIGDKIPFDRF